MSWIKIHQSLPTKPEVFTLSQTLLLSRQAIIGHLVELWLWLDQVTEDGRIKGNLEMIDDLTSKGFGSALIDINWLNIEKGDPLDILEFINFERHNGTSAKKRSLNCRKVQRHRARKVTEQEKEKEDLLPEKVTKELPEKRREDKNKEDNKILYQDIVAIWNNLNSPKVERITSKRKIAIRALLKEFNKEDFIKVCDKVPGIRYLQGDNEHGWRATFDYILRPDKFIKILEGGWDKQEKNKENKFHEWNNS